MATGGVTVASSGGVELTGTSLTLNDVVTATGQAVTLTATSGSITQAAAAAIDADSLTASAQTGVALATASNAVTGNRIGSLAASTATGGVAGFSRTAMTVGGTGISVAASGGVGLEASSLTLDAAVAAAGQTVTLTANDGGITQTASGTITAEALRLSAAGAINLAAATGNAFSLVSGSTTAGGIALLSTAATLTVDAALTAAAGSTIALTASELIADARIGFAGPADAGNTIRLTADRLTANGADTVDASTLGTVRIATLGSATDLALGTAQFSDASLEQVVAGRLIFVAGGDLSFASSQDFAARGVTTLELVAGGGISQANGTALTVTRLAAAAGTGAGDGIALAGQNAIGNIVEGTEVAGFGLRAGGDIAITSTSAALRVLAGGVIQAGAGADVTLRANDLVLAAAIQAAGGGNLGTVSILPNTPGRAVTLGGNAPGTLSLLNAEIAQIAAGTGMLRIGSDGTTTTAGVITIAGDAIVRGHAAVLDLRGQQVTQTGGILDVATLTGAVTTVNGADAAGFALDRLVAGEAVNSIDTLAGVTASGGTIGVASANSLTVTGNVQATAPSGSGVALLSAGTLTIGGGVQVQAAGGGVALTAGFGINHAGSISATESVRLEAGTAGLLGGIALSGDIASSGGDISLRARLGNISQTAGTLTAMAAAPHGTVALVAEAGSITQSGTGALAARQLIARASGSVSLSGSSNSVHALLGTGATGALDATAFTVNDPARLGSMAGLSFVLNSSAATLTVAGLVRAGTQVDGTGTVTAISPGRIIRLLADDMVLDASLSPDGISLRAPGGTIELAPHTLGGATPRAISLGGAPGSTNNGELTLDSAELAQLDTRDGTSAGTIVLGRADAGAITIRGQVDLRGAPGTPTEYEDPRARTLVLASGGAITEQAGARLNVERFAALAGGAVVLDGVNVINTIAGTATHVTAAGASGAFSVAGISAHGAVTLRVGGRAGVADASLAALGTTPALPPALDANGNPLASVAALTIAGAITTNGAGDITLRADDLRIAAALNAGAGRRVVLQPVTAGQGVLLGGAATGPVGAEPADGNALSLTAEELGFVTAGLLRIGGLSSLDGAAASTGWVAQGQQAIDLTSTGVTTLEVLSAYGFVQLGALLSGVETAGLTVANLAATVRTADRSGADDAPATVWLGADNHIGRIGDTSGLASSGGAGIRLTIDRATQDGVLPSNVVTIRQAAGQALQVADAGIALNRDGGRVTLIADILGNFAGSVSVNAGTIELLPRTAGTDLSLGVTNASAVGEISATTLAALSTNGGVLRIGRSVDAAVIGNGALAPIGGGDATLAGIAGADNSRMAGNIAVLGNLSLRGVADTLELYAGVAGEAAPGSITQAAGTSIDVAAIAGGSRGFTALMNAGNTIDAIAQRRVLSAADAGIGFRAGTGAASPEDAVFALNTGSALLTISGQVSAGVGAGAAGSGAVVATGGAITLLADDMALEAALVAPGGLVALAPHTDGRHIALARSIAAAGSNELGLTAAELAAVHADTLIIGRAPEAGGSALLGRRSDGTVIGSAGLPVAGTIRQYGENIDLLGTAGNAGAGPEGNQGTASTLTLVAQTSIQQRGRSGDASAETEGNGPDSGDARGWIRVGNLTGSARDLIWLGADNRIATLAGDVIAGGIAGITVGSGGTAGVFTLRQAPVATVTADGLGSGNPDNRVDVAGSVTALGGEGSRITLVADALDIPAGGKVSAPGGTVEILPATAGRGVTLGGMAANTLSLTTAALARIGDTAGATTVLRIGRSADAAVVGNANWPTPFALGSAETGSAAGPRTAGDIALVGDVALRDGADLNRVVRLELHAGVGTDGSGTISQTGGGLNVQDLAGSSRFGTTLGSVTNRVDRLAVRGALSDGESGVSFTTGIGTDADNAATDGSFTFITTRSLTIAGSVTASHAAASGIASVTVTSAGSQSVNAALLAKTGLVLSAATGIINTSSLRAMEGDLLLVTANGAIVSEAGTLLSAGTSATLTATGTGGAITVSELTAGRDAILTATGGITVTDVTATTRDARLTSNTGLVTVLGTVFAGRDAVLGAGAIAVLGSVDATRDASLTASGDISYGTILAGGTATLTSTAGDIAGSTGSAVTAGTGTATLSAANGHVTLGDLASVSGNAVNIAAGLDSEAGNAVQITATGGSAVFTVTGGALTLGDDVTVLAADAASLSSFGNLSVGARLHFAAENGDGALASNAGSLGIDASAAVSAGGLLTLSAQTDITLAGGGSPASSFTGGGLAATAATGTLDIGEGVSLAATTGALTATATDGLLRIGDAASLRALAGSAALTGGIGITGGTDLILAGRDGLTLAATAGVVALGDGSALAASAGSVTVSADGLGGAVTFGAASTVTAGNGSVTVSAATDIATGAGSQFEASSPGPLAGDVSLTATAGALGLAPGAIVTASRDALLTAGTTLDLGAGSGISAGRAASVTATGAVGVAEGVTLQAGTGRATLRSTGGALTLGGLAAGTITIGSTEADVVLGGTSITNAAVVVRVIAATGFDITASGNIGFGNAASLTTTGGAGRIASSAGSIAFGAAPVVRSTNGTIEVSAQTGLTTGGGASFRGGAGVSLATATGDIDFTTAATIAASAGPVSIGATAGAIRFGGGSQVSAGSGPLQISGATGITATAALTASASAGDATLASSGGAIDLGSGSQVTAGAGSLGLSGTAILLGNGVTLSSRDGTAVTATATDITVGGGSTIRATAGATSLTASLGHITLNSGTSVTAGQGALGLVSGTGLTLLDNVTATATGGDFTMAGGNGAIGIGTDGTFGSTTGNATLTGTAITLGDGTDVSAATGASLTASTGTLALGNGASVTSTGGTTLLQANAADISLGNGVALSGGALVLASGTGIAGGTGFTGTAGSGNASLEGGAGSVTLGANAVIEAEAGALAVSGTAIDIGTLGSLTSRDGITLGATAGSIELGNSAGLWATAGGIGLASTGTIGLGSGTAMIAGAGDLILAGAGGISTGTGVVATVIGGNASLTSSAGDITTGAHGSIAAGGGSLALDARAITLGDSTVLTAGTGLTARARTGMLTAGDGVSLSTAAGTARLEATLGGIRIGNLGSVAGGAASLSAATGITAGTLFFAAAANGDVGLAGGTGGVTLGSGAILGTDTGSLAITGAAVDLGANGTLQARNGIGVTATTGRLRLGDGSQLSASAGGLALTASAQDISLGAGIGLAGAAALTLQGATGISAGTGLAASTAGNASLAGGAGAVTLGDGASVQANSGSLALTGASVGIGANGALQARGPIGLTASAGAIGIGNGTAIRATAGAVGLTATGDVILGDGSAVRAGAGNATLLAGGAIASGGLVEAAGAGAVASLTASTGSITLLGSATAESGSVKATADVILAAATGISLTGQAPEAGSAFTSGILQAARGGTGHVVLTTAAGDITQSGGLISARGSSAANSVAFTAAGGRFAQAPDSGAAIDAPRLTGSARDGIELLAYGSARSGAARGNQVDVVGNLASSAGAIRLQTVESPTLVNGTLAAAGAIQLWSERALTVTGASISSSGTAVASAIGAGGTLEGLDLAQRAGLVTLYSGGAITVTGLTLNAEAAAIRAGVPMLFNPGFGAQPQTLMLDGVQASIGSAIAFAGAGGILAGEATIITPGRDVLPAALFDSRVPAPAGSRLALLESGLGAVQPDLPGGVPKNQPTKVRVNNTLPGAFGPGTPDPAGDIALNLQMVAHTGYGLQNQGAAFLLAGSGNISGTVEAGRLGVVGNGGSMTLLGTLNGQTGAGAAQYADITQVVPAAALTRYRINGCVVTSINCVVPPQIQIVPPRTVDRASLTIEAGRLNTAEVIIPNVSDEDDE
ncbi:hypothetical protein JYK14_21500 [Siccirubricoccus sp. KC 17139]|uniref:Uncharacterized protein n=1 Tax=Siccirubricoccus soli TaxID=2899147 RepID=A0ABT1D9X3_9PROT|nr:hypothetical protein [Siccirubricoccus soli]MCO6418713.1 hypothetical protein [Siccirubricoccus soli]MCP2684848.1 hypothetical protein [Siccirubricoccus soli]